MGYPYVFEGVFHSDEIMLQKMLFPNWHKYEEEDDVQDDEEVHGEDQRCCFQN